MAGMNSGALMEQQLIAATQIIEKQLDSEIEKLDNLDSEDLDAIRRERLAAMKKRQQKKQEWITNVSGTYFNRRMLEISGGCCCFLKL